MKAKDFLPEDKFGTNPKRPARAGARPPRKHDDRTKQIHQLHGATGWDVSHLELLKPDELDDLHKEHVKKVEEQFCETCGGSLAEAGKASRALCVSGRPDNDLGASNLASCKSQGLRARDGEKSHKLGKTAKSRIKVGGHRIKGNKYGGPLPDWS